MFDFLDDRVDLGSSSFVVSKFAQFTRLVWILGNYVQFY